MPFFANNSTSTTSTGSGVLPRRVGTFDMPRRPVATSAASFAGFAPESTGVRIDRDDRRIERDHDRGIAPGASERRRAVVLDDHERRDRAADRHHRHDGDDHARLALPGDRRTGVGPGSWIPLRSLGHDRRRARLPRGGDRRRMRPGDHHRTGDRRRCRAGPDGPSSAAPGTPPCTCSCPGPTMPR